MHGEFKNSYLLNVLKKSSFFNSIIYRSCWNQRFKNLIEQLQCVCTLSCMFLCFDYSSTEPFHCCTLASYMLLSFSQVYFSIKKIILTVNCFKGFYTYDLYYLQLLFFVMFSNVLNVTHVQPFSFSTCNGTVVTGVPLITACIRLEYDISVYISKTVKTSEIVYPTF